MTRAIPEKVLLCVQEARSGRQFDMELPSQMPVKLLAPGIARVLGASGLAAFSDESAIEIWYLDRRLKADETLSSVGIWDGSEITIRERGAVNVSDYS